MRGLLLGGSPLELKCRFVLNSGILLLASSCTIFAIGQMDALVIEQRRLDGRPSDRQDADVRASTHEAGHSSSGLYPAPGEPLTKAIHWRRAYVIIVAEIATVVGMILSAVVVRHLISQRPQQQTADLRG